MKNYTRFLSLSFTCLCFPLLLAAFPDRVCAGIEEVMLMLDGRHRGAIETYSRENKLYLDANRCLKRLGGKLYWYPVSGELVLHINRIREKLYLRSDEVIIRTGKVFVSIDFFTSERFISMLGRDLTYNQTTHTLQAGKQPNVTRLNYSSYRDKTRVVLTMKKALDYNPGRKNAKRLDIIIPKGIVESADKVEIGDGVVDRIVLAQKRKSARLSLFLGEKAGKRNVFRLKDPDRIVIDVFSSAPPPPAGQSTGPDASKHPAAVLSKPAPEKPGTAQSAEPVHIPYIIPRAQAAEQTPERVPATLQSLVEPLDQVKKRMVIDPGHGGRDPGGRRAFGLKEKTINLRVAKQLARLLEEDDIFDVLLTRTSDVFMPLKDRSRIANEFKADIFISLHANASRTRKEHGFETYFMAENASDPWAAEVAAFENAVMELEDKIIDEPALLLLRSMARNEYMNESSLLAARIARQMAKKTPMKNRGVKQAAFFVLRGTYSPAVLIEMGFMTNPREQTNLCSRRVRRKLAAGIYAGIMDYTRAKGWVP